jgi:hypothetical protein
MSVRTATRNLDLLDITTPILPQLHVESGTNPNASGSAWRQQGGLFLSERGGTRA